MNGSQEMTASLVATIVENSADINVEIVVCPPFLYTVQAKELIKNSKLALGVQNVSERANGAFTGEISATMLADLGGDYAIIGHSERRSLYSESDELIADKFAALIEQGVKPIICVGETLEEREAKETEAVVARQLEVVLEKNGIAPFSEAVIAYEPVWAIGTGMTATPEQAQTVHAFIRARLAEHDEAIANKCRILYGGSVKPGNAEELFNMTDIDGGLIGGASLVADDFLSICKATR